MNKFLNSIRYANYAFWERIIHSTYTSESSLGIFRWIFGFYFLLLFSVPSFRWLANAPDAFYDSPTLSLANLFNGFPPEYFLVLLDILILLSTLLITVGIKTRIFSWILLISWFIGNNFAFSFGKIDHNIIVLALILCMSFSGWGKYYALIPDQNSPLDSSKKSLALFSVFVAFGMFSAGWEKALNWIDFDFNTSGFFSWFYPGYFNLQRTELLAPFVLLLPKWIFELAEYLAVILELSGFITLLLSKRAWLIWLFSLCLFHLANALLLNIPFVTHILVYLVFINFEGLRNKLRGLALSRLKQKYLYFPPKIILFLSAFSFTLFLSKLLSYLNMITLKAVLLWIITSLIILIDIFPETKKHRFKLKKDIV